MSGTDTTPTGEVRVLGTSGDGMVKTRLVSGDNWKIHIFPSREAMQAFARAYDMRVVEASGGVNDEGDNGA